MKIVKKLENLVIGGDLEALEFSFREGYHIFYEKLLPPFYLDKTKESLSKKDVLENYAFILSLAGLNLHSYLNSQFRLEKNKLTISGKKPYIIEILFKNLYDFTKKYEDKKLYKVIDYIDVRSCGEHDIRELKTEENLCREIYFYPSKRVNTSKNYNFLSTNYEKITKDAIIISYIEGSSIEKEENSPIYTRLKLKEIMKSLGIRGKKCGIGKNGKQKYNSIKLEFKKREILEIEQERNYFYTQSKNKFLNNLYNHLYGKNI